VSCTGTCSSDSAAATSDRQVGWSGGRFDGQPGAYAVVGWWWADLLARLGMHPMIPWQGRRLLRRASQPTTKIDKSSQPLCLILMRELYVAAVKISSLDPRLRL
jgi:hypothetical protein